MTGVQVVSYRNSTSNHNYRGKKRIIIAVVSYRNSTSNHNLRTTPILSLLLYLIEILHQTTTWRYPCLYFSCCILSKFYIKPQRFCVLVFRSICCILSKFYIKPQLLVLPILLFMVVSYRNSTSNHNRWKDNALIRGVVSYRNSTSNHNSSSVSMTGVQLYLIEILHQTTTREVAREYGYMLYLIEILHQTTTLHGHESEPHLLYLIEILHQTTT